MGFSNKLSYAVRQEERVGGGRIALLIVEIDKLIKEMQ
jgi:hypothetical protein